MAGRIVEIGAREFEATVLRHDGPAVVDFYSTDCPPCEALAPKFEAASLTYGDAVRFVKIFRQENRELAEGLSVRASPTLLFFDHGKPVGDRLGGAIKRAEIERNISALVGPEGAARLKADQKPVKTQCDLVVIGGGPAGLTAAIYAAQARLDVIVVDAGLAGGNVGVTHQVSNFPGFPAPQPGYALAHAMLAQAKAAGAQFRLAVDITRVDLFAKEVEIDGIETISARAVVVSTGSTPRRLGIPGEKENIGRGISFCATCDAKYYEGKHVVVIGGGNSAVEESMFIARFASRVTVVHQFAELQANKCAQEQAFANPKIEFIFEHEPREFVRNGETVGAVVVEDLKTRQRRKIACDGVFIFVGMQANLGMFNGAFAKDAGGYIRTDPDMRTGIPGVFAAGDVVSKRYRQITTAVADGSIAAIAAARDLGEPKECAPKTA